MEQSIWLQKHSEQVNELLKKDGGNKKKGFLIAAAIFAVLAIIVFINNSSDMRNALISCGIILGMMVFVLLIMLLATAKRSKMDPTKDLRQNLSQLLTTPEAVQEFDLEMSAAPLLDFDCGGSNSDHLIITEHYVGVRFTKIVGFPDYRFARRADIAATNFAVTKDESKVMGLGKLYMVDLLNKNGQVVLGCSIHGKDLMDRFEAALQQFCPGIQLKQHSLLG